MPPLIALAATFLPDLVRTLAGDTAGTVAARVGEAVRIVAGTDDPEAAAARLADPAAATALRTRLAEIAVEGERVRRAAELDALRAHYADVQDARGTMVALAGEGSGMAWGAPAVSLLVAVSFFTILLTLILGAPLDLDANLSTLLNIAIGTLGAAFTAVVNFWIGSSQGSRDKERTVRELQAGAVRAASPHWGRPLPSPVAPPAPAATAPSPAPGGVTARAVTEDDEDGPDVAVAIAVGPQGGHARGAAPVQATARAGDGAAAPAAPDGFERCLAVVLEREGGYSNHPQDRGGPTNHGVTQATLSDWRGEPASADDVRSLRAEEAREIYRARYWTPMRCEALPGGLDLMVFDFGVNAGCGRSVKLLQKAVGVREDGSFGPITRAALDALPPRQVIATLARLREDYYRGLSNFPTFGNGWLARTTIVRAAAEAMAP